MASRLSGRAGGGPAQSNRLATNTAWMCASNGLRIVLLGAYFVIVARSLGAAGYGEFIAVAALAAMLAPFGSLGTGHLMVRDVSREPAAMAESWSTAIVTTAFSGLLLTAALLAIAGWALAGIPLPLVLLVGLADLMFAPFSDICGKAFQAQQRLHLTARIDTTLSAAKLAAALALCVLIEAPTPVAWACFYVAANAVAAAMGVGLVYASHGALPLRLCVSVRAAQEGLYFAVSQSAQAVQRDIDKTLIIRLSGPQAAGIYAAASRIVDITFTPIYSLVASSYAGFFRHGASGLGSSIAFGKPLVLVGALYGLAAGLGLAVAAPVLPLVLGEGFEDSVAAVQWLALIPLAKALHYVAGNVLTGAGFQRLRTGLQLLAGTAAVGMGLWAIPLYSWRGAAGAAVASHALLVGASLTAIAVKRPRSCTR